MKTLSCLTFFLSAALYAYGADPVIPPSLPVEAEGGDRFMRELVNMLTTLGIFVAALYALSWVLKRMLQPKVDGTAASQSSRIKISDVRVISAKTTIYVVDTGDKEFTLAETQNGNVVLLGETGVRKTP